MTELKGLKAIRERINALGIMEFDRIEELVFSSAQEKSDLRAIKDKLQEWFATNERRIAFCKSHIKSEPEKHFEVERDTLMSEMQPLKDLISAIDSVLSDAK